MFNPTEHLIDIKGKQYLPVAARIAWFYDLYLKEGWCIVTTPLSAADGAYFRCDAIDNNGKVRATGHGFVGSKQWARPIEKAETAAIGRCLAILGLGTLFAQEFVEDIEEGEIADAPLKTIQKFNCERCLAKKKQNVSITQEEYESTKKELGIGCCKPCAEIGRATKMVSVEEEFSKSLDV